MIITNTVNTDLWIRERTQEIHAVQGDSCTRKITVKLFANREPWMPEADVSVVIRYQRPDGTGGSYDTLPDGKKAWELIDNSVSFILAPQMLAVPGRVAVQVEMLWGSGVLASFPLHILVEENVAAKVTSSGNYFSWEQRLERELLKTLEQAKQSGEFTGATPDLQIGEVSTLGAGEMATASIRGTPENPILDLALPRGADATVDATLSVSGSAADAAAVGTALEGKASAPTGFYIPARGAITLKFDGSYQHALIACRIGLGKGDTLFHYTGYGDGGIRATINVLSGSDNVLYKILPESTDDRYNGVVLWNNTNGEIEVKVHSLMGTAPEMISGDYGLGAPDPFEWVDPPMEPGVEYCTKERWNGKRVWTVAIDCGAAVNPRSDTLTDFSCLDVIRVGGRVGDWAVPYIEGTLDDIYSTWAIAFNFNNKIMVKVYAGVNIVGANTVIQVWYTKD